MLTLLLPVTRAWSLDRVCAAIEASDLPRENCIVIQDAPGCDAWTDALSRLGFTVKPYVTGNDHPPVSRIDRRPRHVAMRRLSQHLVPDGPLLCLEDDVLVCPDIYARLSAIGPHATGVVYGRHECRIPVIYPLQRHRIVPRSGVEVVHGCGYNCLLTTGEAYRAATIGVSSGAVDEEHTAQLIPLRCDWGCVCGHLCEDGTVIAC